MAVYGLGPMIIKKKKKKLRCPWAQTGLVGDKEALRCSNINTDESWNIYFTVF
jgi:hypothetical protein